MTIWILASVLVVLLAALGYRQGAIRVLFSFAGIVVSWLLAGPLAKFIKPLLPRLGVHDPTVIWLVSPFIVFVILLALFKVAGFFVHRKMDLFYKYKAGDLRMAFWKRLNARLGLCLGMVNALAYLALISFIIYDVSYWTAQIALSDDEPRLVKLLNRLGADSETTGYARIARAMDPMPEIYFRAADLAGLLCQNPQLRGRLADYPMFISLTERDEFKQLGNDADFQNAWKQRAPIGQLINNGQFKSIRQNQDLANLVWDIVQNNLDDLRDYLQTGQSAKYDSEKIVGRWDFNVVATLGKQVEARPAISAREMRSLRVRMTQTYAQTAFVAGADKQAFLKNLPHVRTQRGQPPVTETVTWQGPWANEGTNYVLSLTGAGQTKSMPAQTDGARLIIKTDTDTLVFDRED